MTLAAAATACHFCDDGRDHQAQRPGGATPPRDDWYGLREGEIAANCRRSPTPRSIISAISIRHGRGAKIVRRTPVSRTPFAPSRSIRVGPKACKASRAPPTSCCSIGSTTRAAISWCNRHGIIPNSVVPLRCARRRGPIRSRSRWRGLSASRAIRSQSSASTASTIRRCSTSSRISLDRFRANARSAGTPNASADLKTAPAQCRAE